MGETHQFRQVDVFGSGPLTGNPVAVVHDADDLDDARMQLFAQWTNLSETTFLLRPTSCRRRLPAAHLHRQPRAAVRRSPDPRQRARVARGRRYAARRDRRAGVRCRSGHHRAGGPAGVRGAPASSRRAGQRRGPRPRHPGVADHARRHRRQQVVRQRAGLGRRTPEGRPDGPRPAARPRRVRRLGHRRRRPLDRRWVGRRRRGPRLRQHRRGPGHRQPQCQPRPVAGRQPPPRAVRRGAGHRDRPRRPGAREAGGEHGVGGRRHPHDAPWRGPL